MDLIQYLTVSRCMTLYNFNEIYEIYEIYLKR